MAVMYFLPRVAMRPGFRSGLCNGSRKFNARSAGESSGVASSGKRVERFAADRFDGSDDEVTA
jgi:hypothetical protein